MDVLSQVTCQNIPACRITRGARHLPTCPRYGTSSGPSGKGLQPRSNVDTAKLDTLRTMLALEDTTTPNQVLDAMARHLESTRSP